jgi:hypothetical protein
MDAEMSIDENEKNSHNRALLRDYTKKLRILERDLAKLGSYAPPHIELEIDEIKAKIQEIENNNGIDLPIPQNSQEIEEGIENIRRFVRVGNIDNARILAGILRKNYKLTIEHDQVIEEITSDDPEIHLLYIFTTRNIEEEIRYFDPSSGFLNEHLAHLLFPYRKKLLTNEMLKEIFDYSRLNPKVFEINIFRRINYDYRLTRDTLPPPYFINDMRDETPYFDAFRLSDCLFSENECRIIIVFGKPKSGKTTTLKYLEYIDMNLSETSFYIYVSMSEVNETEIIAVIEQKIVEMLLNIFVKYTHSWNALNSSDQQYICDIFRRYPDILQNAPINSIKNLKKSNDTSIERGRKSLIKHLQEIVRLQRTPYAGKDDISIEKIGDILEVLEYSSIYISIDDAKAELKPNEIIEHLDANLSRQIILLRIAYCEIPLNLDAKELAWDYEKLNCVFETIAGRVNPFTFPPVRENLIRQVYTPDDFSPWLTAFRERYPDEDVKPEYWEEISSCMHKARQMRDPSAKNWLMEDWLRAKEFLSQKEPIE